MNAFFACVSSAALGIISANRLVRALSSDIPDEWEFHPEIWRAINLTAVVFYLFVAFHVFPQ